MQATCSPAVYQSSQLHATSLATPPMLKGEEIDRRLKALPMRMVQRSKCRVVLNALMAHACMALQLSTREGFEVKVSEAVHAGIPIIACQTGGIPLQIEHSKSGYLTMPGDNNAITQHLYDLHTDEPLHRRISEYAKTHVCDEVGTIGNAPAWLYLAVKYTRGEKIKPKGTWLNDMLREETGELFQAGGNCPL
ncbi:hypothetical protein D9615_008399 [Tricholomella constricta]|uniref:Glycosyl transferase family 1 domain-containing protein n=1 Tax=Tricholomella constricta TaxID=117010 RepID=A0A8H5HDS7_9AGAR|nr:hypothetical protein D9615_008399 [Tricholomella constricta]